MGVEGKKYCEKCGTLFDLKNFYSSNNLERFPDGRVNKCKKCWTMHVDNWDPDTFLPLLEEVDVPYLPDEWKKIIDRYLENNKTISGTTIIGKYLGQMKLVQHRHERWADTEILAEKRKETIEKMLENSNLTDEEKEEYRNRNILGERPEGYLTDADLRVPNEHDVSEAMREELRKKEPKVRYVTNKKGKIEAITIGEEKTGTEDADSEIYAAEEVGYTPQQTLDEDDINILNELTEEDKTYLKIQWGKNYRPSEMVQLEKLYQEMLQSYDIQTAGHKDTLKLVCKASLKTNQLMDIGDIDGALKASRMYDSLMKSGKFTAAQNKAETGEAVDSIAEIALLCEKEYGFLPSYYDGTPKDCVDQTLEDLKRYTYNLVTQEQGLGGMIEQALRSMQKESDRELAIDNFDELDELTDQEYNEFRDFVDQQLEEDEIVKEEGNDNGSK